MVTTQEKNLNTLCEAVPKSRCPSLTHQAEFICKTFKKAFTLFWNCHHVYDSATQLTPAEITVLGRVEIIPNVKALIV